MGSAMMGLLGASRSQVILRRNAAAAGLVFPVWRRAPDGLRAWTQVVERGYEDLGRGQRVRSRSDWTVEEDRWRRTISVAPSRGPNGK